MASSFAETLLFGFSLASLIRFSFASVVSTDNFNNDFSIVWSQSHVYTSPDGHSRSLKLDQQSGAAFASNDMFLFGQIDMQIKLISGYSAGTVLAYYLSSDQPNRDELDFEFLGNSSGQPHILQTNVYVDGNGSREERISLWFDPAEDFHTYTIFWNLHQIVFMVDWVPIRVYKNHQDKGVAYPSRQPMSLKISLWNGDTWATRGGLDKIDWSKGPFVAYMRNYKMDACVWKGNPNFCRSENITGDWWKKPAFNGLTFMQRRLFRWVRKFHLLYDYCSDSQRFGGHLPKECSLSKFC